MALILNKQITTKFGVEVPNMYIRLIPTLTLSGKFIKVEVNEYISKEHFNSGVDPLPTTFFKDRTYTYDSELEGLELLPIANSKFKQDLINNYGVTFEQVETVDPETQALVITINANRFFSDVDITIDGEVLEIWDGSWKEPNHELRILIPLKDVVEKYNDKVAYLKTVCPYYYINRDRVIELYLHQIFPEDRIALSNDPNVTVEDKPV
jgi:hypothetical protein